MRPRTGTTLFTSRTFRNLGGPSFAYRLTIRAETPDFTLVASPDNPNIPQGGSVPVTVSVNRFQGYKGPIEIEVKGLPKGVARRARRRSRRKRIQPWSSCLPRRIRPSTPLLRILKSSGMRK